MDVMDLIVMDLIASSIIEAVKKEEMRKAKKTQSVKLAPEFEKRGIVGIFYNTKKRIVVIKWKDNTVTKAVCSKEDDFDLSIGFAMAYFSKKFGSRSHFVKLLKDNAKCMDEEPTKETEANEAK